MPPKQWIAAPKRLGAAKAGAQGHAREDVLGKPQQFTNGGQAAGGALPLKRAPSLGLGLSLGGAQLQGGAPLRFPAKNGLPPRKDMSTVAGSLGRASPAVVGSLAHSTAVGRGEGVAGLTTSARPAFPKPKLGPNTANPPPGGGNDMRKRQLCKANQAGICPMSAESCFNAHSVEDLRPGAELLMLQGYKAVDLQVRDHTFCLDELEVADKFVTEPCKHDREVWVDPLPDDRDIKDWLAAFGEIEEVFRLKDQTTGFPTHRGYIRFKEHSAAKSCVEAEAAVWSESERALKWQANRDRNCYPVSIIAEFKAVGKDGLTGGSGCVAARMECSKLLHFVCKGSLPAIMKLRSLIQKKLQALHSRMQDPSAEELPDPFAEYIVTTASGSSTNGGGGASGSSDFAQELAGDSDLDKFASFSPPQSSPPTSSLAVPKPSGARPSSARPSDRGASSALDVAPSSVFPPRPVGPTTSADGVDRPAGSHSDRAHLQELEGKWRESRDAESKVMYGKLIREELARLKSLKAQAKSENAKPFPPKVWGEERATPSVAFNPAGSLAFGQTAPNSLEVPKPPGMHASSTNMKPVPKSGRLPGTTPVPKSKQPGVAAPEATSKAAAAAAPAPFPPLPPSAVFPPLPPGFTLESPSPAASAPPEVTSKAGSASGPSSSGRGPNWLESLPPELTQDEEELASAVLQVLTEGYDNSKRTTMSHLAKDPRVLQCKGKLPPHISLRIWIERRLSEEVSVNQGNKGQVYVDAVGQEEVDFDDDSAPATPPEQDTYTNDGAARVGPSAAPSARPGGNFDGRSHSDGHNESYDAPFPPPLPDPYLGQGDRPGRIPAYPGAGSQHHGPRDRSRTREANHRPEHASGSYSRGGDSHHPRFSERSRPRGDGHHHGRSARPHRCRRDRSRSRVEGHHHRPRERSRNRGPPQQQGSGHHASRHRDGREDSRAVRRRRH